MPNWAFGVAQVTGKKKNVREFIEKSFLSVYDSRPNKFKDIKFFARSFITDTYTNVSNQFNEELGQVNIDDECTYSFTVQFAWSALSCLIDGYPQRYANECTDLSTACRKYEVDVVITTEETGMCFEEHIACNRNGEITMNECYDMPRFKCLNCGNEQCFPSQEEEYYCYECDKEGFKNWEPIDE